MSDHDALDRGRWKGISSLNQMITPLLTPTLESGHNDRDYYANYPTLSHRALLHTNVDCSVRGC